jgi:hypothetical protein
MKEGAVLWDKKRGSAPIIVGQREYIERGKSLSFTPYHMYVQKS